MPTTTSFWDHPIEKLEEALSIRKQIAGLQRKLGSMFGGIKLATAAVKSSASAGRTGRRSEKVRARMAAAQQARWAKIRGNSSNGGAPASAGASTKKRRRTMSPEARERIAAAQRARWAKAKGTSAATASIGSARSKPARKRRDGKRTISPEGRARIAEAARQRWARLKKGK